MRRNAKEPAAERPLGGQITQRLHTFRGAGWLTIAWLVASCGGDGATRPSSTTVATVSVSAVGSTTISIGTTVQFQALASNAAGQPIPGVTFIWTSQNPGVAHVSDAGLVTGISAGTAAILASAGGRSAQVTVTVLQPPPPPAGTSVMIDNWYLRVGFVGAAYPAGVGILASGGDGITFVYEVVAGALPPGITLGAGNGLLSGTPTASGTFFFDVRVTSAGQAASRVFALSVSTKPVGGYNIAIVNASGMMPSATNRAALDAAVAKWERAILTDLPPLTLPTPTGLGAQSCQGHASKLRSGEVVEDLVILTAIAPIDGVGSTVAQAGPCGFVAPGNLIWIGSLTFDEADLAVLDADRAERVILHEIGHVVGIGTLWTQLSNNLLSGAGEADPQYTGQAGVAAYQALGGAGPTVPVENTGGAGTRDGHWREVIFDNELMTGFLEAAGVPMPLSIMSIRSLEDVGWTVDPAAADPYVLPPMALRAETGSTSTPLQLWDDIVIEPLYRFLAAGPAAPIRVPR